MGRTSSKSGEGGFENRPLAGLARLRGELPEAEAPAAPDGSPPSEGGPAESGSPGPGEKLVVQRERKKRGGKTVTRVRGLGPDAGALAPLARSMAKALGCGASVEGEDVLLQGDQVERAAAWLERRGAARVVRGN